MGTAAFVRKDTTTQGSWVGVYGSDGYNVEDDSLSYPAYATVNLVNSLTYSLGTSADARALTRPSNHSQRVAGSWYSANDTSFTIDIQLTGGTHQVAVYLWSLDGNFRNIEVSVLDADHGNARLCAYILDITSAPVYLVFNCSGHVAINILRAWGIGANLAMANGIFFDPPGTPASISTTASLQTIDTTSKGDWITAAAVGSAGYAICDGLPLNPPAWASVITLPTATFGAPSLNAWDLLNPANPAQHIPGQWNGTNYQLVDVTLALRGKVSAYFNGGANGDAQAQFVDVVDLDTGTILYSTAISLMRSNPAYYEFICTGHIGFLMTLVTNVGSGGEAYINGIFFDAAAATGGGSYAFIL